MLSLILANVTLLSHVLLRLRQLSERSTEYSIGTNGVDILRYATTLKMKLYSVTTLCGSTARTTRAELLQLRYYAK